jgi:methane/ammonia monooxygenase subunit B
MMQMRLAFSKLIALIALACAVIGSSVLPALAHGERAQEPYLRTRTVQFYDVHFSKTKVAINEEFEVTGAFHLMTDWPDAVAPPDVVFVSTVSPGPTLTRVASYLNDEPARQSFAKLDLGRDYRFRLVLKARTPGTAHIHPTIAVKGSGALVGPGQWIETTGNAADFSFPLKTLTGERIPDLQTYGLANAIGWHVTWIVLAAAWLLFWLVRPLLLPRWIALLKGREDVLVSLKDVGVALAMTVVVLALVFGGYAWEAERYPYNVPLQSGTSKVAPLPASEPGAVFKVEKATYDVPGRSMRLAAVVTNISSKPLTIGELTTANIRFINRALPAETAQIDKGYPDDLIARNDLVVSNNAPLNPGESRHITIEATDAVWETERLVSFLTDVDSKFGGLVFLYDDAGQRHIAEIGGPIVPTFTDIAAKVAADDR